MNYYDKWEAHGSCWYQSYNLWTDRTEQEDWKHPTQRFKNYLHNQYITLITVDHQNIYGKTIKFVPLPTKHLVAFVYHHHQQEIPGEYLDNPTGTNTLHSKCYLGGQEPGTGVGVGGKWMYPWKLHGGQNEREGHQTFMACYDQAENMNANLPRNI